MLLAVAIAVIGTATAHAAYYKMVACSSTNGAPPYGTSTNTASPQNPAGIFHLWNWCDGEGGDPPGDGALIRIQEHQNMPNTAGEGAYGNFYFDTPAYIHYKTAGGYTRQPYQFHDGWRARFWVASCCSTAQIMTQGAGLGATSTFALHVWPFAELWDFNRFVFELTCVRPGRCDVSGDVAADLNGLVFVLSDDSNSQVDFTDTGSPFMQGKWVRGTQNVSFNVSDLGSGLRNERMLVDGSQRWGWDHWPECGANVSWTPTNGEWARTYQPCPGGGPWGRTVALDTGTLGDGSHAIRLCTEDYGQYQGLYGTKGETCTQRSVLTDNSAPGAPSGLRVTSANPARYLDRFGASFSLPPNQGSPIAKVHYEIINAAGNAVVPERVVAGANPTELTGIAGPARAGDYRLRVWLEDEVGFSGPAALAPIPHDTTPPAAPQVLSVTSPATPRSADGFDLRWQNIVDAGAPIDAAHYDVLDGSGKVVVPSTTVTGDNIQAVGDLDAPGPAGSYQLRLWLSDAEGNVGAPITAPLSYECQRSSVRGATLMSAALNGEVDQTLQQGQGTTLTGSVRSPSGAIATSPVCVFSRVETDPGREFLGIALTDGDGGYRFPIPAGPSREVIAIHRDGNRQLRASAKLHTVVHPTLRAQKTTVHNGESAFFEGEIPGPHNDNVTIVLQVKSGQGWLAFRRYRTRNDGHFEMTYPFSRTKRPTNYEMRAQVREAGGYPYVEGDSDPVALRVLPESAKPKKAAAKGRCAKKKRVGRRGSKRCPKKHRAHHRAPAPH